MLWHLVISLGFLATATDGFILGCVHNKCQHECVNILISLFGYECRCHPGYLQDSSDRHKCIPLKPSCGRGFQNSAYSPYNCVDIDECRDVPCEQNCRNSQGSYECSCRSGYVVSTRDPTRCERPAIADCGKGFQPNPRNPESCIDIDECAVGSRCEQLCRNSQGSYECNCRSGYQINERDPSKCDIIDNCQKGFRPNPLNPTQCQDINECEVSNPCEQVCSNTNGGFICSCRDGFIVSATNSAICEVADKCRNKPCEHVCTNTASGYQCSCRRGYAISRSDPSRCNDVDECSGSNPCEQVCTNTAGGYVCSCRSGYTISATDDSRCESVDKCNNNNCEQTCTSTSSGYQCSCKRGYVVSRSDPTKCQDINECSDSPCEHTCTNTNGGYKCSCRDGFAVDPNNKNKCTGGDACSTGRRCEHICTIISTGRKCSCKSGYVINDEDPTMCDEVEVCKTKADVILVFDASSSIGAEHFDKQFVFAKRLTSNFKLGSNDVRFGGIVYSRFAKKLFDLKDYNTLEPLHKALSGVEYMDSSTYTDEAFLLIQKEQLFSTTNGGRGDAPNIVVLFTDGDPTYEDRAIDAAQSLKDSGTLILGVAIGRSLDLSVLKKITSSPDDALEATSYDTLDYIEKRLTQLLCKVSQKSG